MELEIEENRALRFLADGDCAWTSLNEELESDFQHVDGVPHGERHRARRVERGQIERES